MPLVPGQCGVMPLEVSGDRQKHIGPKAGRRDGGIRAHDQIELPDRLDFLVDVGELIEPVGALP